MSGIRTVAAGHDRASFDLDYHPGRPGLMLDALAGLAALAGLGLLLVAALGIASLLGGPESVGALACLWLGGGTSGVVLYAVLTARAWGRTQARRTVHLELTPSGLTARGRLDRDLPRWEQRALDTPIRALVGYARQVKIVGDVATTRVAGWSIHLVGSNGAEVELTPVVGTTAEVELLVARIRELNQAEARRYGAGVSEVPVDMDRVARAPRRDRRGATE